MLRGGGGSERGIRRQAKIRNNNPKLNHNDATRTILVFVISYNEGHIVMF